MMRFIKENWLWMVLPFILVLGGILLFAWLGGSSDDGVSEFIYSIG